MFPVPLWSALIACLVGLPAVTLAETNGTPGPAWPQWRGPTRDGQVQGHPWPDQLTANSLQLLWRVSLKQSYSGPVLSDTLVFTTETRDEASEAVIALDRRTGEQRWKVTWEGAIKVPFFAASNGSWIRATPAFDGESLYVAGMRDVLVCLDAETGQIRWRVDFVERLKAAPPAFGFVCSPLVDGDVVFVQAGAAVVKLNKHTGEILWRTLSDSGGMNGSAFSSPIIATLAGQRQLVVQTRQALAGVDLESGEVLWKQQVPAFRGMNILTPTVYGDAIFTSSYRNNSWLYGISQDNGTFRVSQLWENNAKGYMSSPVVIGDHAFMHLQNQRFACIDLKTGERNWTSRPFGKYWSLVAQGDRILALDSGGELLYLKANPAAFELLGEVKIADAETWAHLAISGEEVFVRELNALAAYRWLP